MKPITIPVEIVDMIVKCLIEDDNTQARTLAALVRVCQAWKMSAQQRLYSSINIPYLPEAESASLLLRSLTECPNLGRLVTKLSLYIPVRGAKDYAFLGIIEHCPLRELSLSGFAFEADEQFLGVIMDLNLRVFNVDFDQSQSTQIHGDREEILHLLQCWPMLEKASFGSGVSFDYLPLPFRQELIDQGSVIWGANPILSLRELDLRHAGDFPSSFFMILSSLPSPYLTRFTLKADQVMDEEVNIGLIMCLAAWASHLKVLELTGPIIRGDWTGKGLLVTMIKGLPKLETLSISTSILAPRDLISISTLTAIMYRHLKKRDVAFFKAKLQESTNETDGTRKWWHLPNLSCLRMFGEDVDTPEMIRICKDRQISHMLAYVP